MILSLFTVRDTVSDHFSLIMDSIVGDVDRGAECAGRAQRPRPFVLTQFSPAFMFHSLMLFLFLLFSHFLSLSLFVFAALFEVGTPITGTPCSFTVTPHKNKSDVFISPTYPGAYPKDMSCTYHFIGEPSQRVRLEFRDFDLFFGGPQ